MTVIDSLERLYKGLYHQLKMTRWTICVLGFLYFLQGMPYGIQIKFLPVLLRAHGVSLTHISLFKLLFLPWVFKLLWAPFVDRHGTKKQWLCGTLLLLSVTCAFTSLVDFSDVSVLALMLLLQNTFVSVQDISVDALAVSVLSADDVGLGNVAQVVGYKCGGVIAGGIYMMLHNSFGHGATYLVLTAFYLVMLTVIIYSFNIRSMKHTQERDTTSTVRNDIIGERTTPNKEHITPPHEYSYQRTIAEAFGVKGTIWMALYTILYKCGENGSIAMLPMFLLDNGVSETKVAFCTGIMGSFTTILGSLCGGLILKRYSTFLSSLLLNVVRCVTMVLIVIIIGMWAFLKTSQMEQFCDVLLLLCCAQLFLSGVSSILTFSWMMHLSQRAPVRIQSTHYTVLATSEILGKLVFGSTVGYIADSLGYSQTFYALLFFVLIPTMMAFKTPQFLKNIDDDRR